MMIMLRFFLCFFCNYVVILGVILVEILCFLEFDNCERYFCFEYEIIFFRYLKYFVFGVFLECFFSWNMSLVDVIGVIGG